MRKVAVMLVGVVLAAGFGWSGELAGVKLPDEITVADADLVLNGIGLRKKLWVEVYVAGLYLPKSTTDATEAVSGEGPKKIVMHFLTDKATKKKMDDAWIEGFEGNSPASYASLKERVRRFAGFFGDMKKGDVIELEVVPGVGTTATYNDDERGVIEGDDFGIALLQVWLGDKPPSDDLRAGMLGFR